ncbi:hypothetical protein BGZ46_009240 [Entomortierella lignicola]|nr:hypothetical protein BGZ46_009240 [Entomortierella lignicola]
MTQPRLKQRQGFEPTQVSGSSDNEGSPWKSYHGIQKAKGPGSDTGSISASESGRGASSVIKEPIARLSAGIKATVFSAGYSTEPSSFSESGSASGVGVSLKSKLKARYRASADLSASKSVPSDGRKQYQKQQQPDLGDDPPLTGRTSKELSITPYSPPPTTLFRDRYLSPNGNPGPRAGKDTRETHAKMRDHSPHSDIETESDSRLPSFATNSSGGSSPILLNSYFTLHDSTNGSVQSIPDSFYVWQ